MKNLRFILVFIIFSINVNAQSEMLIGQISDRFVVRENYDEDGVFLNKQTFDAGEAIKVNGYYEIKVTTETFDENKKSINKYSTTYRCNPNEATIMIMAFSFSNPKSKKTGINTTSNNFKDLYDLENLKNIELEMTFDSGLLSFFGSKSIIKIYDRKIDANKNLITSKINLKAYGWGILVKDLNYSVNEKLNNLGLLTFQKFTEEDGSYFTMTYKTK